ncbi:hypothetical protein ACQZV8_21000, partial [Magnetococcales bacterium HHB-1]
LLNVGQLSITATGEVSQATDTGTVTVHGKDNLDVTTFDLHAKTAVSLTQEAASDFIFAGIAGGLNNDDLAEINIKTGGGFSFTASSENSIASDRLNIIAGGNITYNEATDALDLSGGLVTAGVGKTITLSAQDQIDLGGMNLTATDGTVSITANQGGVALNSSGLITTDTLTVNATDNTTLSTSINTLNATISGDSQLDIQESDAITLKQVSVSSGSVQVTAGNTITATSVIGQSAVNLTALSGDILIDSIQVDDGTTVQGKIGLGAQSGTIQEVTSDDSGADLIGYTANLRGETVILNDASESWATQNTASGLELNLTQGADNDLNLSMVLGDLVLDDDLLDQISHIQGDALSINVAGKLTVQEVTTGRLSSLTAQSGRDLTIEKALSNQTDLILSAGNHLYVANDITLITTGDLSLSAGGDILHSDQTTLDVDVGGTLSIQSTGSGTVDLHALNTDTLNVSKATLAGGSYAITADSGLSIAQMTGDKSTIALITKSGDLEL